MALRAIGDLTIGPGTWSLRTAAPQAQAWLRDEWLLIVAVSGASDIIFLPGAWLVTGMSVDFVFFAASVVTVWLSSATLQIVLLRYLRGRMPARLSSLLVQAALIGAAGALWQVFANQLTFPFAERLGLLNGDEGRTASTSWTAMLIGAYLVWQREASTRDAAARRRLYRIQHAQLAARRAVVEAQLRAVQARVDLSLFFGTLNAIERLYADDRERAERLFDELVVFLRAVLPHIDSESSLLGREIDLAASCVRIHSLTNEAKVELEIDVADPLLRLPFPAGVLLPLVRGMLDDEHGCSRLRIDVTTRQAAAAPATLILTLESARPPPEAAVQAVAEALRAMHGPSATLRCETVAADRCMTLVSVPQ